MQMNVKKTAAKFMPTSLKNFIKWLRRLPLKIWVKGKKVQGQLITKEDIIAGLKELEIKKGDTVFVHSSFSSFGFVKRGPEEVIDALLEAVGSEGNVCMPSFGPLEDGKTFDVKKTPSALGKITDVFWRMPNAKRSLDPTHSFACVGKDSELLTKNVFNCKAPFEKGSPYYRLMQAGGKVLCLGSPFHTSLTCNYLIEDELGLKFPVKIYLDEPKEFYIIDSAGKKHVMVRKVHDKSLDSIRVDWNPEIADWFEKILSKKGCLKKTKVGEAMVRVYGIKCMIDILREMAGKRITIYKGYGALEDF